MAADYKKLLIQYIDKIVFGVFLLLFIALAIKFVTATPNQGEGIPQIPQDHSGSDPALYDARYVLRTFTNPLEPDARNDLTTDPEKIQPGPTEKQCPRCGWISPRSATTCPKCKYNWLGGDVGVTRLPENGGDEEPVIEGFPFKILVSGSKEVDVLFMGIYRNPKGEVFLQINWADNTRTTMVPEGGFFQDYRLFDLKKEDVKVNKPGIPPYTSSDYFVTLQKEGGTPVRVRRGQSVQEELPVATLQALKGEWRVEHKGKAVSSRQKTFEVYAGDTIINMEDRIMTFEVLKVTDTGVTLKDKDGKEQELPARSR